MKKIYLLVTTFALAMFSVGQLFSQTITVTGSLNAFAKCSGAASASQSFAVQGAALTDDIEIAALAGLEYSTDNATFSATLTLAETAGAVASTTVYVRMTAGANAAINGNISLTSGSVTSSASLAGVWNSAGLAKETAISGDYAYIADGTNGLDIVDVSTISAPQSAGALQFSISGW